MSQQRKKNDRFTPAPLNENTIATCLAVLRETQQLLCEVVQKQKESDSKAQVAVIKIHNLQVEVQSLQRTIAEANRLWIAILQNPSDRLDASAELARERALRIEQFKKT